MATKAIKKGTRKWSARVTKESDALDLKKDIFKSKDPDKIAVLLKHSAEASHRLFKTLCRCLIFTRTGPAKTQ